MPFAPKRTTLLCAPLLALAVAACGSTAVSTSSYKGASKEIAKTIANLQSDLSGSDQKNVCTKDLSAAVVRSLATGAAASSSATAGCEAAIKRQEAEIDNTELGVNSIKLGSGETTAVATVRSIYEGKTLLSTITLVKEGGSWKISATELILAKTKKK